MKKAFLTRTIATVVSAVAIATTSVASVVPATVAYAATTDAHAMYYVSGDVTTCAYYGTDNQEQENRRFTYWNQSAAFTKGGKITTSLKEKTTPCWSADGSYLIYQEDDGDAVLMEYPSKASTTVAGINSVSLDQNNLFASATTATGTTVSSTDALLALANGSSSSDSSSATPAATTTPATTDTPAQTESSSSTLATQTPATTVTPATPSLSSYVTLTDYTGTYDGKAHAITAECKVSGAVVTYSTDNQNFSATNPTFTNVGNYTVYVKVTAVGYSDYSGSAKVNINAAPTTPSLNSYVTLTDYTGTYDGKAHAITAECKVSGATISYSTDNKSFSATNPTFTNVGNYTVYVKVTALGYSDYSGSAKVNITAAPATSSSGSSITSSGTTTTYEQNGSNSTYNNGDTIINNYYNTTDNSSSNTTTTTKWTVKNNAKHTSATLYKNGKKVGVLKVSGKKLIWKGKTIKTISKTQWNVGVRFKNVGFTKNGAKIAYKLNTGKKYTAKRTSPKKFSATTKTMSFAKTGWVTLK